MKSINFQSFTMPKGISGKVTETGDVRESFANAIYDNIPGIAAKVLAEKIYTSEGAAIYKDEEIKTMRLAAANFCTPRFIDALEAALADTKGADSAE